MRFEAADGTCITLVSEMVDEKVLEKKESYLKATTKIPLSTIDPGPETIKSSVAAALARYGMPNVDKVRAMSDRESNLRLRPCVTWQGSKEVGGHPERHSSPQLRRLCLGDVKASGGSVLLVPVITSLYRRLGRACEGGSETGELHDELV